MSKLRNVLFAISISGITMMGFSAVAENAPVEAPADDMVVTSTMPEADASIFNDVILDDEVVIGDIVEGAIIGDELSAGDIDSLMLKVHGPRTAHRFGNLPGCHTNCKIFGTSANGTRLGHCRSNGRVFNCTRRARGRF